MKEEGGGGEEIDVTNGWAQVQAYMDAWSDYSDEGNAGDDSLRDGEGGRKADNRGRRKEKAKDGRKAQARPRSSSDKIGSQEGGKEKRSKKKKKEK